MLRVLHVLTVLLVGFLREGTNPAKRQKIIHETGDGRAAAALQPPRLLAVALVSGAGRTLLGAVHRPYPLDLTLRAAGQLGRLDHARVPLAQRDDPRMRDFVDLAAGVAAAALGELDALPLAAPAHFVLVARRFGEGGRRKILTAARPQGLGIELAARFFPFSLFAPSSQDYPQCMQ